MEKLTKHEVACLEFMCENPDVGFGFDALVVTLDLKRSIVKRAVRRMAKLGLAEHTSLFNDDGGLVGSGYVVTKKGRDECAARRGLLPKPIEEGFKCIDCKVNTDIIHEYYMVHDALWRKAGMTMHGGMLCIGCLETRLKRRLTPKDFTPALINASFRQSARLRNRLYGEKEDG